MFDGFLERIEPFRPMFTFPGQSVMKRFSTAMEEQASLGFRHGGGSLGSSYFPAHFRTHFCLRPTSSLLDTSSTIRIQSWKPGRGTGK